MKLRHRQRGFVGSGGHGGGLCELHVSRYQWTGRRYALTLMADGEVSVVVLYMAKRSRPMLRRFIVECMVSKMNAHAGIPVPAPKPHRCRIGDEA